MTMNAGVWIDYHKAVVVLLTDDGQEILEFRPDSGISAQSPVGLKAKNSYTPNDFVVDGKREQKVKIQLDKYYDEVIACVRGAQAILILGPEKAKGEFRKRMARQRSVGHIAEMKTVVTLTGEQITDYVRQHFQ